MIIPRVKKELRSGKLCTLPYRLTVCVEECYANNLCRLIGYLMPESNASAVLAGAVLTAVHDENFPSEKFTLSVEDGKVDVTYGDYLGLRNAIAVLASSVTAGEQGYTIDQMQVEDQPVAQHRGVMLDLARGMKDYSILCEDLVMIAKARMNVTHLHIFDSQGSCMQLDSLPASAHWEGCYSKQQMIALCDLAQVLGLEIIPEFDMPAHSTKLIEANPEFACDIDSSIKRSNWTICTGTEAVYEMYEKVIAELATVFPGKYIHIGGDELEFADIEGGEYICHWDDCSKCLQFRKEHDLADRQDQFYYFVNRINAMIRKNGKQTIMWSDQMDCAREVKLDKDIIMHFWRVAGKGRGPYEGCSMNAQLSFGYEVINSYYPETYLDLEGYASSESLRKWHWTAIPECEDAYKAQIRGGEMEAWEYGNAKGYTHYEHSLPSGVFIMADKLWNGDELPYSKEYAQALTKEILGACTPEGLDVFECIGDLIPPRDVRKEGKAEKLAYVDRVNADVQTLHATLDALKAMVDGSTGRRAKAYSDCIQYVIDEKSK